MSIRDGVRKLEGSHQKRASPQQEAFRSKHRIQDRDDRSSTALDVDIVGGVIGEPLTVFVVSHRRLEVLMAKMRLGLLRFGAALDGQRAAGVPERMCRYVASNTSLKGIAFNDQIDGLRCDWLSV